MARRVLAAVLVALSILVVPTARAEAYTATEKFTIKVYADFLFRAPTSNELAWWNAYIGGGGSRQTMVSSVLGGTEFKDLWIAGVDYKYLGYYESVSSLASSQESDLYSTGNYLETELKVLESADYYAKTGSNNTDFVKQVYRDLLLREADPTGLSYWVGRLNAGTSTRRSFAATTARSTESANRRVNGTAGQTSCAATVLVDDPSVSSGSYCIVLDRLADSSGYSYWSTVLAGSGQLPDLWANLAGSTEYYNKAQ